MKLRFDSMYPKILIVCTTPYSTNSQSRATDTYFHNWPKECLRQIFSNSQKPMRGHCSSLFQIKDSELAKKIFNRKKKVGTIYEYDDLDYQAPNFSNDKLKLFKKRTWIRYYLRKFIWKRKRWLSDELLKWTDEFKPDIVFCGLSDDYFILDISLFFSQRYNAPIVTAIGDDYYFIKRTNLLAKPYFKTYKKLFDRFMETDGFAVYISDKIAAKYNSYFKKQGFPIYLSSDIQFKQSDIDYSFNYFGNLELGRNRSIELLGDILNGVNNRFSVNVYAPNISKKISNHLSKHHCVFKGSVPYEDVKQIMNSGSFNVVASGFSKKDIERARYSLSTKVADALASSGPIIAIGPEGDGAIDYLSDRDCSIMIKSKNVDLNILRNQLLDKEFLAKISSNAKHVYSSEHNIEQNRAKFEQECIKLIGKSK